jgi:hypothetical protein
MFEARTCTPTILTILLILSKKNDATLRERVTFTQLAKFARLYLPLLAQQTAFSLAKQQKLEFWDRF